MPPETRKDVIKILKDVEEAIHQNQDTMNPMLTIAEHLYNKGYRRSEDQLILKKVNPEELKMEPDYLFEDSGGQWWVGTLSKDGTLYIEDFGPYDPKVTKGIYEIPKSE